MFVLKEELDPEEQLAEKLRVKKLQEAADLELAKDAFGEKLLLKRCGNSLLPGNMTVISNT